MTEPVSVQITGTVDEYTSALEEALSSTSEAFQGITAQVNAASESLNSGFASAAQAASRTTQQMSESVRSASGQLGTFSGALEGLGGIVEGALSVEAVRRFSDEIMKLSERAENIRNYAETLQLSAENMQGLTAAAQQTGVGAEVAERGTERLVEMLDKARQGSGEARAQLHDLGVSIEDIHDKSFGTAELIDRIGKALNDSSTSARTHAALIEALGPRYALLGNVLKNLRGELGGLSGAFASVNGITSRQNDALASIAERWNAAWTSVHNTIAKWVADMAILDVQGHQRALAQLYPPQQSQGSSSATAEVSAAQSTASQVAAVQKSAADQESAYERQLDLEKLQNEIQLYNQGTAERLAASRRYYQAVAAEYGADAREAIAAQKEVFEAQRALQQQELEARQEIGHEATRIAVQSFRDIAEASKASTAAVISDADQAAAALEQAYKQWEGEGKASYKRTVDAYDDMTKQIETGAQKMGNALSSSIDSALEQMATHGKSFGQAMASVWQGIEMGFVKLAINLTVKWAATQAAHLAEAQTAQAQQLTLQAAGAAQGAAIQKSAAASSILIDAKKAFAGAYSAVAGVPIIGPVLAPVAGAAAFAATAAMASFDAGGLVPDDIVASVHKDEMVLPPALSKGLQNMIASGGGSVSTPIAVHAIDGKSVERFFSDTRNQEHLAKALRSVSRRAGVRR